MPDTRRAYEHVQHIYLPIAAGVFAVVAAALLVLLIAGARRRIPGRRAEAPALEAVYAVVLSLVVAFLLWVTFTAESPIDRTAAHPALRLRVVAAQWSWRFIYANGATVSDVATWHPAPAYVPAGVEVEIVGTSEDVIHGFWIPALHYQRQLLPGQRTRFDLLFRSSGYYAGVCSVLCGEYHSQMHFAVQAVSPEAFRAWLARQPAGSTVGS